MPQLPSQAYLILWTGKNFEGLAGEYCQSRKEVRSFLKDSDGWSVWSIGNGELSRDISDEFELPSEADEYPDYAASAADRSYQTAREA